MATFSPPFILERPQTGNRLIDCWAKVPRGITVLKSAGGAYSSVQYPTVDDLAAAAVVYQGGHDYTVSSGEAAALTAAGYGAYLS